MCKTRSVRFQKSLAWLFGAYSQIWFASVRGLSPPKTTCSMKQTLALIRWPMNKPHFSIVNNFLESNGQLCSLWFYNLHSILNAEIHSIEENCLKQLWNCTDSVLQRRIDASLQSLFRVQNFVLGEISYNFWSVE